MSFFINEMQKGCKRAHLRTKLPYIFAAGDIKHVGLQVAVALGEGVSSALSALKYLGQNTDWLKLG